MTTETPVPLEVGDHNKLVLILGHLHSNPLQALREFIQNARDAVREADLKGEEALIRVHLEERRRNRMVRIVDNGIGIPEGKLRRIPLELCSSEKLDKFELEGEFGIGLLSYVSLAEKCEIVSKSRGEGETWRLVLPRRSALETGGQRPLATVSQEPDRPVEGTEVILKGLHKEVLDRLQPAKVDKYLARHYGSQIRNHQFQLDVIASQGKKRTVKPARWRGDPFLKKVHGEFGEVDFELYLNARPGDRSVQILVGPTVLGDISEAIQELNRTPWNEGRMEGEVRCDYLEPLPHRHGVKQHHEKFPAFLRAVGEVEPALAKELARISAEQQKEERARMITRIQQAFKQLAREQEIEHQFQVAAEDPEGEEGPGSPVEDRVPAGSAAARTSQRGATMRRIDRNRTQTARQRWRRGIDLEFDSWLEPYTHSDSSNRVIRINEEHRDYRAIEGKPALFGAYVATCAMKEVTELEYGGWSPDSMEEFLSLQTGMQRLLGMGVKD